MADNEEAVEQPTDAPEIKTDNRRMQVAEKVLAARYGSDVRLTREDVLREQGRNHVLRCVIADAPEGVPASVIVKNVEGEGEHAYDPANDKDGGTAWRLYNEWAGNQFLDEQSLATPLGAGFIGGDRAAGLIVLHDLGKEGKSLADAMQGDSREELVSALLSYAASLGKLHAVTAGKEEVFMAMRREIGGTETTRRKEGEEWRTESVEAFRKLCAAVDVTLPEGFDSEVDTVAATTDNPGAFRVFSPGDACPDNHRLTDSGYVRFFDFEFAGFTHALLAAAYFYLPFPTCWCVNRLPAEIVQQMESVYRKELSVSVPEALENAVYFPTLLAACAYWTITTVTWGWENTLEKDGTWGISTVRQRHLLRLENFIALSEKHGVFPALTETARFLRNALLERFTDVEPMPVYLPFRETALFDS